MSIVLCLCRSGFEKEVAAELTGRVSTLGIAGYIKAVPSAGYAQWVCYNVEDAQRIVTEIAFSSLIFIRHWFVCDSLLEAIDTDDRVTPLATRLLSGPKVNDLQGIVLDTNDGKSLSRLTRSIESHLKRRLVKQEHIDPASRYTAQLLFLEGDTAFVGYYPHTNTGRWPAGVVRLRMPKDAPSRATLKLDEAWHHFIPKSQWPTRLSSGLNAVDLGAAPGGWTYQLVRKGFFVDAIDNGPMDSRLMDSGQVKHHLADGFQYQTYKKVYWLVCDIADKPRRVASLIARWASNLDCNEAIFNLKLPMKQRYDEVQHCAEIIESELISKGIRYELRFKQLYHDREEVTGHLRLL